MRLLSFFMESFPKLLSRNFLLRGIRGYKYGFLIELSDDKLMVRRNPARKTPMMPARVANSMNIILHTLMAFTIPMWENISDEIAERAITITIIGETIPAETAASPRTIAPSIDIAVPDRWGILISLSRSISKTRVRPSASTIAGNGTPSLWAAKLISKVAGIVSWLYVIIAI